MPSTPRVFTRAEDELIVKQSRDQLHLSDLRTLLRANLVTINRRAAELGVKILLHQRRQRPVYPVVIGASGGRKPEASLHDDLTPARIRDDKLLKKLSEVHGNRGYS